VKVTSIMKERMPSPCPGFSSSSCYSLLPPYSRRRSVLAIFSTVLLPSIMRSVLLLFAALPAFAQDASLVRESGPLSPEEEAKKFKLPPGFSIQLIASEPVVNKPMNLAFDEKGQLWCTSSAEYPWAIKPDKWKTPEGLLDSSKDKIIVFSDSNGDGVPDKPSIFADNLNIPIGVLPYKNGCIAWSIPNIWRLEDTDGDGKCDKRTILFGPLGWEMDTHGMISSLIMGPDGWVYATHGFNNTSHIKVLPQNNPAAATRKPRPTPSAQNTGVPRSELDWGYSLDLHSGNVFRFKPDGSAVEPCSWGQVNPFGMCQDGYGSFYTADCHTNPITALIPGAFYQSFGKPHDGMNFAPVMCEHAHGSTGLCGVTYIDGGIWGPEWDDHIFVGNCVTSRINHDLVTFTGATPKANEKPDFLSTDDGWFRPVNLQMATDSSLYVADFYNRIIGHYEVPLTHPGRDRERGRIWRIVKEGAKPLATRQQSAKAGVWKKAQSVRFGQAAGLATGDDTQLLLATAHSWIMHPTTDAIEPALRWLGDALPDDHSLRHSLRVAIRACLQQPGGFNVLANLQLDARAESALPSIVRTIQSPDAAAWTLSALMKNPPANPDELRNTVTSLAKDLPEEGEAYLIVFVDKFFDGDPNAQLELAGAIRQGIARRGGKPGRDASDWLKKVAARLFKDLEQAPTGTTWDPAPNGPWALQPRRCADGKETTVISSLGTKGEDFGGTIKSTAFACPQSFSFFLCGHRGPPNKPPHELNFARLVNVATGEELAKAFPPRNDTAQRIHWDLGAHAGKQVQLEITDGDKNARDEAYAWLAAGRFEPALISVPNISPADYEAKHRAAAQMAAELSLTDAVPVLSKFLARTEFTDETRGSCAAALVAMHQPKAVADVLKTAPSRLQNLLGDILAGTAEGAALLMDSGVPRLLAEPVISQKIAALKDEKLTARAAALTKDLAPASAETAALIAARVKAHGSAKIDLKAGEQAFKINCQICHQLQVRNDPGGMVGPRLTGVGQRGVERLCEDILDPHRAVDPMFHMHIITMKDGAIHAGLIRRNDAGAFLLVNATGQETSVPKAGIAKDELSPLSLMPATFGLSIPEADFHSMLAWLAAQK
jgi:putative membrane-bound dehydrogenase-like protein